MANTKAYIQSLQNKEGADVYPVTVADAVYVQTTEGSTTSQQKLSAKLKEMETNFTAGCNAIIDKIKSLGVTPSKTSPEGIAEAIGNLYSGITVTQEVSGRSVKATATNGNTSTTEVALGTDSGNHSMTLTPTGNNSVSFTFGEGYYYGGTVVADGSTAYAAGRASAAFTVRKLANNLSFKANGQNNTITIDGLGSTYTLWSNFFPMVDRVVTNDSGSQTTFTWGASGNQLSFYSDNVSTLSYVFASIWVIDQA